jgi:hypothetical protein
MDLIWLRKRREARARIDSDAEEIRLLFGEEGPLEAARRASAYRQPTANLREANLLETGLYPARLGRKLTFPDAFERGMQDQFLASLAPKSMSSTAL